MNYFMVHVPGSTTQKMHMSWNEAEAEAKRIANSDHKTVNVLSISGTIDPPAPELESIPIEVIMEKLARDKSLVGGLLYGMLHNKLLGSATHVTMPKR